MELLKKFWLWITTLSIVLLTTLHIGNSFYRNHCAKVFVHSIEGVVDDPPIFYDETERDVHGDLFIRWNWIPHNPPSCDVTINAIYEHEQSGLTLVELGQIISKANFKAVHTAKNGHLTIEPIISQDIADAIKNKKGTWLYKLQFTFHCSVVSNEWLSILNFDKTYTARHVIIEIE